VLIPDGGVLIDTPGMRALALWDADEGMAAAFPDIEALAERCRFRDCNHVNEPGCAVIAAVAAGELSERRLASYRRLSEELVDLARRQDERSRREKKREGKIMGKAIKDYFKSHPEQKGR